jgi:hypothetical protein
MEWTDEEDRRAFKVTLALITAGVTILGIVVICLLLLAGPKIGNLLNRIINGLMGTVLLPFAQEVIYNPAMDKELIETTNLCCPICIPISLIFLAVVLANRWLRQQLTRGR